MGIFVSVEKTIECVVIAVMFACALILVGFKMLGILQSGGYSGKKLFKWLKKRDNMAMSRIGLLALSCFLASAIIALSFSFVGSWACVIGLVAFVIFFAVYAYADSKYALRTKVVLTPRLKRLLAIYWLVCAVVCYIVVTLINFADCVWGFELFNILKYSILAVMPLLVAPLICLANLIAKIYEIPHNKSFVKKAKAKMQASQIKVVGITGSFGKTSAKNILAAMLSKKYKVLATPSSHNTPMGLACAINDNNIADYDIFIAEMGARNVGDIKELCDICQPDYSLITGICPQHLESFGSEENIVKTKAEIISATKNDCVISADCFDLFEKFEGNKQRCNSVSGVVADSNGVRFTLTIDGNSAEVSSKLLGEHSAYNIGLCAELAYKMGVSFADICESVKQLDYVEHRLQLIKSNGVNIIDDGYNANIKGAEDAIEVLKKFDGKKVVVTPGIVELGILEKQENAAFGAKLVGLDQVILVGDTLVGCVKQGYLDNGGDQEKLLVVPTLGEAQQKLKDILKSGDTVLFLNDLPDVY
jgi:UDP-N-acetylmuramoyl-tripeptide--D-alanyl-D-alanine ligase